MRTTASHTPVLLELFRETVGSASGAWVDCTFGAGGHSRALLAAGADRVFGIDRDPEVHRLESIRGLQEDRRLSLICGTFGDFDTIPDIASELPLEGVVFDLGVSSIQLDQGRRGFSFMRDGPLDMRMSGHGASASDIVNESSERELEEIFRSYGEEKRARAITNRIASVRKRAPIQTTRQLAELIEDCFRGQARGKTHPATRCFQALRIAVNDELGELARGLRAAERALCKGGLLVVLSFHSLEDRIVKNFLRWRGENVANRHYPPAETVAPGFKLLNRGALVPDREEMNLNPRSRSAKLRLARRTSAPAREIDSRFLDLPPLAAGGRF